MQSHETAKAALEKAKEVHQAAEVALQQPVFVQQPYWCDGIGASASAHEAWIQAGLPLRAVVYLKAPKEGEETRATQALIAGLQQSTLIRNHCSIFTLLASAPMTKAVSQHGTRLLSCAAESPYTECAAIYRMYRQALACAIGGSLSAAAALTFSITEIALTAAT